MLLMMIYQSGYNRLTAASPNSVSVVVKHVQLLLIHSVTTLKMSLYNAVSHYCTYDVYIAD